MKTNKIIVLAAIILASCSSDKQAYDGPGNIVFGTLQKTDTRGTAYDGTLADGQKFGVYAYRVPAQGGSVGSSATEVEPGYMGTGFTTVTKQSTGCTYSPVKPWPTDMNDRVKFFAYSPLMGNDNNLAITAVTPANVTANPYFTIAYTAHDEPSEHVDLMYATTSDIARVPVLLSLKHALTRVTFSAQAAKSEAAKKAKIKITDLEIWNVSKKGVLTVKSDGTASWQLDDVNTARASYTFDSSMLKDEYVPETDGTPNYENILATWCGDLMFIPQPTADMHIAVTLSVEYESDPTREVKNFFMPISAVNWDMGKHVHYRMTVSKDVLSVTCHLNPWVSHEGPTIGFE